MKQARQLKKEQTPSLSSQQTSKARSLPAVNTGIDFTIQKKENKTGLPENLKSGIEHLSGHAMDDVKVHYNSSQPAQLNAHAYAQRNQIHIAPGQEKHLAHEAWHVVQQKQGRVKPTRQLKSSVAINDSPTLEKEADVMGAKALQTKPYQQKSKIARSSLTGTANIQAKWISDKGPVLRWDIPVQGVRWYFDQRTHKMYYIDESKEGRFQQYAGIENARTHEEWLQLGAQPIVHASNAVIDEDEVFTDSDSDSEDPTHDGVRLIKKDKSKNDLAEFDRLRFGRKKIYEDKLANFDQSHVPDRHKKDEAVLIQTWITKQVIGKVSSKLKVIQSDLSQVTVRAHERTGLEADVIMQWVSQVREFKVVVNGDNPEMIRQLEIAIIELRRQFPGWRITAKVGDPKAREDHDKMHGK